MFRFQKQLDEAIDSNNPDLVRSVLVGIIQADPTFETGEFDASLKKARHKIEVYVKNNPSLPMDENPNNWDSWYFAKALTYLLDNFTEDRWKHVRLVGKATHSNSKKLNMQSQGVAPNNESQQPSNPHMGRRKNLLPIIALIVLAALIIFLIIRVLK